MIEYVDVITNGRYVAANQKHEPERAVCTDMYIYVIAVEEFKLW